jgi:hypothetical protein
LDIDLFGWVVIASSAVVVGMSKTGMPGLGILPVPMMALAFSSRESTGLLLGVLILADLFAVTYHRRNARWRHILRLLPAALAGIVAGYFGLGYINDQQLKPIIGGIVLVMLGLNYWRTKAGGAEAPIPTQWWFAVALGFMAGVTTMMANAAGPVMIIYLLAMRLPKIEFVGTSAWFFFAVNWLKVPFSAHLNLVTVESVKLNLTMLPFIALGALLGILLLKHIPQKAFTMIVQILAAAAAVRLLF